MFLDRERWVEDRARVQNYGDSPPNASERVFAPSIRQSMLDLGLGEDVPSSLD
jgi:hypothetical protein